MKELKKVYTNKGIETKYRKKLDKLVLAMSASVMYWVLADYGNRTALEMAKAIQKRIKQWKKVFGSKSEELAVWFVASIRKQIEADMRNSFSSVGMKMKEDVPQNIVKAVQVENNDLIKSIPQKYFTGIETVAMLAILYGWEKERFKNELEKRNGIVMRRVKNITSDQAHKTTELFKRAICEENGIYFGKWTYTYRSETERIPHVQANGTIFDLRRGCLIEGEYIYPGEKINCKCTFVPVVGDVGEDMYREVEKNIYYKRVARGY